MPAMIKDRIRHRTITTIATRLPAAGKVAALASPDDDDNDDDDKKNTYYCRNALPHPLTRTPPPSPKPTRTQLTEVVFPVLRKIVFVHREVE